MSVNLNRLCRSVETDSLTEAWIDLHCETEVLTGILLKQQVLKAFSSKIDKVTRSKYKFDEKYDLLPHEPKSRIQIMMEKRRKKKEELAQQSKVWR